MKKRIVAFGIGIFCLVVLLSFTKEEQPAKNEPVDVTEIIRLYSDGELIGEWEAVGRGRMEGNTYIFKTERGQFSNEYRIKGDFVVERRPN